MTFSLDDFCYKPISGKGCLVTSPMEYFQDNLTTLLETEDVKVTSQCIPDVTTTSRVCFDSIGVPVMSYAIFGNTSCVDNTTSSECSSCKIGASAL